MRDDHADRANFLPTEPDTQCRGYAIIYISVTDGKICIMRSLTKEEAEKNASRLENLGREYKVIRAADNIIKKVNLNKVIVLGVED